MYHGTNGDELEGKAVTNPYFGVNAAHNLHSVGESLRSEDVSLLAVCITDERNVCGSVGIVLDSDYLCGNIVLKSSEIDLSVFNLVSAALMTNGDLTLAVTSCILLLIADEALLGSLLGNLSKVGTCHVPSGRCIGLVSLDTHFYVLLFSKLSGSLIRLHGRRIFVWVVTLIRILFCRTDYNPL